MDRLQRICKRFYGFIFILSAVMFAIFFGHTVAIKGTTCAAASTSVADTHIAKYYANEQLPARFGDTILLKGTLKQIGVFSNWLDEIATVPKGLRTLIKISESGHCLTIQHCEYALHSAGLTRAPMTFNLINGKGESVTILFDASIPEQGSHMVYNREGELIEFTAIQNLYHELAHAMHKMNGTWCYVASEEQAIEEENIFRRDLALLQGKIPTCRYKVAGIMIRELEKNISEDRITSAGNIKRLQPN